MSAACRTCAHFRNEPAYLEASIPGWNALGSAWGSTRSDDGLCELRSMWHSADGYCKRYRALDALAAASRAASA